MTEWKILDPDSESLRMSLDVSLNRKYSRCRAIRKRTQSHTSSIILSISFKRGWRRLALDLGSRDEHAPILLAGVGNVGIAHWRFPARDVSFYVWEGRPPRSIEETYLVKHTHIIP